MGAPLYFFWVHVPGRGKPDPHRAKWLKFAIVELVEQQCVFIHARSWPCWKLYQLNQVELWKTGFKLFKQILVDVIYIQCFIISEANEWSGPSSIKLEVFSSLGNVATSVTICFFLRGIHSPSNPFMFPNPVFHCWFKLSFKLIQQVKQAKLFWPDLPS